MSKPGMNITPKQDNSPFKKDNRGPNTTPNNKDANKRNSGNFNQRPQGNPNQVGNRNQGPQNQNRNQTPQNQGVNRNQGGPNQGNRNQSGNRNQTPQNRNQTPQNRNQNAGNRPGQVGQNAGNKQGQTGPNKQVQNKPQGQTQGGPKTQGNTGTPNQNNQNKNTDIKRESKDAAPKTEEKAAETGEKKFTGRCRLFVGNLTTDITEDDFKKLFEPYGEVSEVYVNTSRGFGFIRLDYRHNAEAAKAALDGFQRKGRQLRVRFATHGAALKVKNLHPYVSNELLESSFQQFGDVERCIVIVDDRGKATGEGIVEFVRKPGANSALRRINEGVFLMGADPKPIAVEPLEQKDEEDGMPEKFITKTDQFKKERESDPRFARPGTFEYEFGMRWKQLEELEKKRIEQVKKDTEEARLKLEDEMQNALYEYQAEKIRQDLLRQQEELRRLEELRNQDRVRRQQEMEIRSNRERDQQEERRRTDMMLSMRQQEIASRTNRGPIDSRGPMDNRGPMDRAPMDVRGPMDGPGQMRSREEAMMAERFGERMPEGMRNRGPEPRVGDNRMPGDRMPDQRMGDRMPERMQGDRMPDQRMGDRMPDQRMGERGMGPGQPSGFLWDEKQQREAGMRGEGRGRDMRGPGPGPQPLQPPPVPPEVLERGGQVVAATAAAVAAAAAALKGNPKPLMQSGPGGPGFGGPQGGPGGPNPQNGPGGDNQQMKRRFDGGPGANEGNFANQRGVLGAPPGALPGARGMGPNMTPTQMRGGPGNMGGGSPNMFAGQGNMDERMMLERRRQAAREEMTDIKRMRRF